MTDHATRELPFAVDALGYAAWWYAKSLGWHVLPCAPRGKHPLTAHGRDDATASLAQIESWWRQWPDANIGWVPGASGCIVLDFDVHKPDFAGQALLDRLLAEHPTMAARSGGGGFHLVYRLPDGMSPRDARGDLPAGVDVKSAGYVVVFPSVHPSGARYQWLPGHSPNRAPAQPLPDVVLDLLQRRKPAPPRTTAPGGDDVARAQAWLDRLSPSRADDYDTWVGVGMALAELGDDGLRLWDAWSRRSAKWRDGECAAKWRSFTPGAGVRLGSLKFWADQDDPAGTRSPGVQAYVNGSGPGHPSSGHAQQPAPGQGGVGSDGQTAGASGDKLNQADILYQLAADLCDIFTGQDARPYAIVPVEGRRECYLLNSDAFRGWLNDVYRRGFGRLPGQQGKQDAIAALAWDARKTRRDVFVRVGAAGGKVYLDLGSPEWSAVEVDADGWRLVGQAPVAFRRPASLRPLPPPIRGGHLSDLKRFMNVEDGDWPLLAAWAVAAMYPTGPYPVLVLAGEQGTAKSTTLQVLKRLIDPSAAGLRGQPQEVRDLFIGATNSWLVAFDNVSRLSNEISDALCRLATGGGYARRALYADDSELLLDFQRPVAVNGIGDVVARADLMDRAILLSPPIIPENRRRNETDFWREFDEARPLLLGGMLDALAGAMRRLPSVALARLPRMADFARLAVAAQDYLGGDFLSAYEANRAEAHATVVETSTLGDHLRALVLVNGHWQGSASDLLQALNQRASESEQRARTWPRVPNRLKPQLERLAPSLRKVGVDVAVLRSNGERVIRLTRLTD